MYILHLTERRVSHIQYAAMIAYICISPNYLYTKKTVCMM